MALSREAAVTALFTRLSTDPVLTASLPAPGAVATMSRAYKLPTEVPPEQQPALFLVTTEYEMFNPGGSRRPVQLGHPTTQIIRCNIIIYATQAADDTNPEGNLLNPLVDAVENAIAFKPGTDKADERGIQCTNLGGMVESVTFGTEPIALVTGTGSLQATILIPLEILITTGR